ncbi:Y-box-binding protein 3 [Camelus dromedarius]|uniref:Y-box-binding protein 3 n=1 Tax=Camelus dromedarius TaxID=9838 RepID=A0A5N4C5W1_CAMDR|nr:Y-box-binding protein 3 [Camelus dromedarius]
MQAGEIGEIKDGVPDGAQLQGPVHRNPTYRPRFRSPLSLPDTRSSEGRDQAIFFLNLPILSACQRACQDLAVFSIRALLAHDPPRLLERLKIKRINKLPVVPTSRLLAVDTGAPITIGAAPALPTLLHKMAKRPRQAMRHLRTPLRPPSRAVLSDSRLPRHLTTCR